MPLSDIQAQVLHRIAANRSPDSYLAGATVINRGDESPRFSQDLDFFHDMEDSVAQSAEQDAVTLRDAGYRLEWLLRAPTFHRAVIIDGNTQLKIEWAQDSAFRFFPVQTDARCGYRLHDADAATNKILALAGRTEARDFVDVLHLNATYLALGAMVWAACGKDPGFTPAFLLDHANRHAAYSQNDIDRLRLRAPLDLRAMKRQWLAVADEARILVESLPPEEIGCLYLDAGHHVVTPRPEADTFATLTRHRGCIRGAWPTVSPITDHR